MVTRKPLPRNSQARAQSEQQQRQQHDDPDSSWGDNAPRGCGADPATAEVPASLRPGSATNYAGVEEDNVWADTGAKNEEGRLSSDVTRVPTVLRPGSGDVKAIDAAVGSDDGKDIARVPTVLRPGAGRAETNPFKRMMSASEDELVLSTSAPNIPVIPTRAFSELSVSESSKNPWQPALEERKDGSISAPPPLIPGVSDPEVGSGVWDSAKPSRQATPGTSNSPALLSLPSDEVSAGWEDEAPRKAPAVPTVVPLPNEEGLADTNAWEDLASLDKGKTPAKIPVIGSTSTGDGWNLIDVDAPPGPPPPKQDGWDKMLAGEDDSPVETSTSAQKRPEEQPPELPPRRSNEIPPALPTRPVDKSETYAIKNINWYDVNAAKNPRTSPILVQNANGPCPLVALVNALSLTTPADRPNTVLVETLRSREQVSLGLLLNAVFEELMSEGRMKGDISLPDVSELYEFLKGLHTGMNVNPRYIPTPEVVTAFKRTSLTHLHPTERSDMIPGTFEDTKEMALYATFSIPLIHGWLPAKEDAVYGSFARQAGSYEDAQNLLFREEELEDKLSSPQHDGLTEEEQQIYQDILTIKSFLSISATQLTKFGLDVIRKSMRPGSVAILFRNDHFSTLYKHPQTHELLTLVTDAGYAGHAEVVWESLVDINGERAEFFSGDFRLVGGAQHSEQGHRRSSSFPEQSSYNENGGWNTVQSRHTLNQSSQQGRSNADDPPMSPIHEQEDRDLALALQLQEEEDERHRNEQERRRRESLLSEQFIEQQARTGNSPRGGRGGTTPTTARRGGSVGRGGSQTSLTSQATNAPARRSSSGINIPVTTTNSPTGVRRPAQQTVRSLIPPRPATNRPADEGVDDAPPSYEQAAKQTPYVPPEGHPSHPTSAPNTAGEGASTPAPAGQTQGVTGSGPQPLPMPGSVPGPNVRRNTRPPAPPGSMGRMRPGVPHAQAAGGKERDCVVM
ncbi:hypothetical protein OQA88_5000 [Cercophora sp. LCS_1]